MNNLRTRLELTCTRATLFLEGDDGNGQETSFSYIKFPELRKLVLKFVRTAAQICSRQLFLDLCTRCGNCCSVRTVPVTAAEIYSISHFLGFSSDEEVRKSSIEPSMTWNSKDGIIKKDHKGCVFLQKGPSRFARCSIYPVRPEHCAALSSNLPECRAELDLSIYHIKKIFVSGGQAMVTTKTGNQESLPLSTPALMDTAGMIEHYLLMLENTRLSDYDRIRGAIESRIMELEAEYRCHGVSRPFLSALEEITSLAEGLHACIEEDRAAIEKLCFKLQKILLQVRGEYVELTPVPADSPVSDEKELYPISSVSIRSQSLSFSLAHGGDGTDYYVEYRHNPDVMEKVRHLLNSIVKSDNEILLDALWHTSATCFMCGECCKSYRVEVTPIDVDRMASHFHMTVEAFRKKYLFPPAFAWNEGNAMLAKIDPQPPDQHFSYSECLFLRKGDNGMTYCSIYEARPDVCREYHASNQLCKRIHQVKRAESLVDNIVSLEIEAHTLVLVTKQTTSQDPPQIRLDMEEEKQILAAYNSLKKALRGCVN